MIYFLYKKYLPIISVYIIFDEIISYIGKNIILFDNAFWMIFKTKDPFLSYSPKSNCVVQKLKL